MNEGLFTLREARLEDGEAIRSLVYGAHLNPFGLDWRHFVVAEDEDGCVIGCGQIKSHGDGARELASLVVRDDWRGRGVGKAIVARLIHGAGPPLWLMCRSELVGYYRRFGFREVGLREDLPRYFRWVHRLFTWFSRLAGRENRLAIMVYDGP